jgi:hypothetical protein
MLGPMRGPGDPQPGFDGWFSPGRFLFLLGILTVITYPGIVFGTRVFTYRDAGLFTYPVAYYFRDCFWHGQWPLWNPYNNCGIPFLAQWNTLTLYPPSLIYLLLPLPWSLNVFLLAHLFLAALGMYRLCHLWFGSRLGASVAALAFAWNGLTFQFLAWSSHVAALAWMPWVILNCARATREGGRRWVWAALAGACQMLTGAPETVLFTWLIVVAVLVLDVVHSKQAFWTAAMRLAWVVALVCALSAAQLLPWLDLLAHGDRSSGSGGNAWALPPWGLANFLVPLFHSAGSITGVFMQAEQQWTSSYYLGILPLLLALVAIWRQRRARTVLLAVLTLAAILLAFGDAGYLLALLRRCIPLLGFTRYPIKFIVMAIFCLSLLAGAGAAWLQTQTFEEIAATLRPMAGLLALGVLVVLAVGFWFPFPSDSWRATWLNGLGRLIVLGIGLGLLLFIFAAGRERTRALLAFGFLLLAGLDVSVHEPRQNPDVAAEAYGERMPAMSGAPRLGESRAMLSPPADRTMGVLANSDLLQLYLGERAELYENCNLLNRIPKVDGFFGIHLAWQQEVAGLLNSSEPPPGLLEFLGVSQIASPRDLFVWVAQTNFMPLATIGQKPEFLDDDAAFSALGSPEFLPRQIVYLPSNARQSLQAVADPGARVLSSDVRSGECIFETSAESRAILVIAQSYYHCWKATVDGKAAELYRANYAYQAVEVPAGRHEVRLVYRDRLFWLGLGISLAALICCFGGLVKTGRNTGKVRGLDGSEGNASDA